MAIEMAAMAEDILTMLRRWDKAFRRFVNAPQRPGPASLGEWQIRLRFTRRNL